MKAGVLGDCFVLFSFEFRSVRLADGHDGNKGKKGWGWGPGTQWLAITSKIAKNNRNSCNSSI